MKQTNKENTKVRVLAVYRILSSSKVLVKSDDILRELKSHYGITADKKTIYSDVAAINRIMPVRSIAGKNGGYALWDVLGECDDG
jgi:predicted DNA-binding transcriptional regulator YafY